MSKKYGYFIVYRAAGGEKKIGRVISRHPSHEDVFLVERHRYERVWVNDSWIIEKRHPVSKEEDRFLRAFTFLENKGIFPSPKQLLLRMGRKRVGSSFAGPNLSGRLSYVRILMLNALGYVKCNYTNRWYRREANGKLVLPAIKREKPRRSVQVR